MCMHHNSLDELFIHIYFGCSKVFVIMNKAAIGILHINLDVVSDDFLKIHF